MATDSMWTTKTCFNILQSYMTTVNPTLKLMYLRSGAQSLRSYNFVSDVVAFECNVSGYSRQTVANVVVTEVDGDDRAVISCNNPAAQTLGTGNTIVLAVVFEQRTNDADSPIWCFLKIQNKVTDGTSWAPQFSASEMARFQA